MELSERKKQILKAVVEHYIDSAEPVGSKLLAQELGVSSATVRNEFAELFEIAQLAQLRELVAHRGGRDAQLLREQLGADRLRGFDVMLHDRLQYLLFAPAQFHWG